MSKDINLWTRKEFDALPKRKWNEDIGKFTTLVILPTRHLHDSGYRCMEYVAVKGKEPICRLGGGSDVIHFDGILGTGKYSVTRGMVESKGWHIDCLKKSGLLRIMCNGCIEAGCDISDFDIYGSTEKLKL